MTRSKQAEIILCRGEFGVSSRGIALPPELDAGKEFNKLYQFLAFSPGAPKTLATVQDCWGEPMTRRKFITALGGAALWWLPALGQQAAASRSMGVLHVGSLEGARTNFGPIPRRLAEMGYVEGQNLALNTGGPTVRRTA